MSVQFCHFKRRVSAFRIHWSSCRVSSRSCNLVPCMHNISRWQLHLCCRWLCLLHHRNTLVLIIPFVTSTAIQPKSCLLFSLIDPSVCSNVRQFLANVYTDSFVSYSLQMSAWTRSSAALRDSNITLNNF
jgi:hypothetical protein